jgi:hypothetical protein
MVTEYTFSDGSMLRETSGKGERGKYKREVFSGQFMAAKAAKEAALEAKKAQEDAEWKAESSARAAENDRKINELLDTITVDPALRERLLALEVGTVEKLASALKDRASMMAPQCTGRRFRDEEEHEQSE